jgi:hypothetical protein
VSGQGLTGRLDRRLAETWDGRLTRAGQRDLRTALLWQVAIALAAGVVLVVLVLGTLAGWPGWVAPLLGVVFGAVFVPTAMTRRASALDAARSDVESTQHLPVGAAAGMGFSSGVAAFDSAVAGARHPRPDDPGPVGDVGRRSQARRRMQLESEGRLSAAAVDALVGRVRWGLLVVLVVVCVTRFRAATRRAQDAVARHLGAPRAAARTLVVHRTMAELDASLDRARRDPA